MDVLLHSVLAVSVPRQAGHLQLIVLPSLTFKIAHRAHLWIEEDLIYKSVCQAFGFDHSCSCCKGIFGRIFSTLSHRISQYKMAAARALTNFTQKPLNNFSN